MVNVEAFSSSQGDQSSIFGTSLDRARNASNACIVAPRSLRAVVVPPVIDRSKYESFPKENTVDRVLRELQLEDDDEEQVKYRVRFEDGRTETVSFDNLLKYDEGQQALNAFGEDSGQEEDYEEASQRYISSGSSEHDIDDSMALRRRPGRPRKDDIRDDTSDDELSVSAIRLPPRRKAGQQARSSLMNGAMRRSSRRASYLIEDDISSSSENNKRRSTRVADARRERRATAEDDNLIHLVDEDTSSSGSEVQIKRGTKRKLLTRGAAREDKFKRRKSNDGTRQSGRSTRHTESMKDPTMGDIYRSDSDAPKAPPKAQGAREAFQPLPPNHPFHLRHCQQCDTCSKWGGGAYGQLVHCQGCSLSYHKHCLGNRSTRDHLVTKIGEADFVLQCRRCISFSKTKDETAPSQDICQHCREPNPSARPFRKRKTAAQEERDREENDGDDPVMPVNPGLMNNAANVLFRCTSCWRGFHYHHLKSRSEFITVDDDEDRIAARRFKEYSNDWLCSDCVDAPAKVSGLVAWRPIDTDHYIPGATVSEVDEDLKEYLVKWEAKSHYRCLWMPGAWVWGITAPAMRKAFAKRVEGPTMNTEDAIPEEYLRIDIVLDVRYTSKVDTKEEEVDKARIREVDQALIKFKGLGYEDAVWETVPGPDDGERWTDFVKAYDDWVIRRYVRVPRITYLKQKLEKVHATDFPTLEKKKQPDRLNGGELMKYQLDGLNWIYYRWWLKQNAVLADEMGLGKTIQVIGFLASLVQDHNCLPFLIVVPNGTVSNWRREIKQWAPSLRVVTYYGSAVSRRMAYQYELFPDNAKELRCHVVVTSYEAASDDTCTKFFRSVNWQGLIVDEGQRLKSDKTILYEYLGLLKAPFKLLLTGTPLQNNARELFNLLQFLDDTFNAADLDVEYAELTKDNVPQLHEMIRPFFLRRTKAQVLTFLPPMAQIVLPVSMSSLQAKLYKSILSRNPELVKQLYDPTSKGLGKGERASLSNLLMQLRKCLCHPFVYSQDIEERTDIAAVSHRNLVEASAKLQLLELLLPKLQQRGHRVLIFSQFLNMLDIVEDFMDGLAMQYRRLDGNVPSMEKQKRIDLFNAKDSPLFAFLLSTRAGGVGINLATADTVIILDPDFNPHQDIQALSRAHRIGQKNKVLCFQLMTRASAEEKIVQIGRKKMALDHVLIEQMENEDEGGVDVESVLRFGAADILEGKTQEIRYDEASIDKLLDRSQMEDTKAGEDNSAESQFSYARVWANESASLADNLEEDAAEEEKAPDPSVWDRILKEREQQAAEEAKAREQNLGRGRRARQTVDYGADAMDTTPRHRKKKAAEAESSDTDFRDDEEEKKSQADEDRESADENADAEIDAAEVSEVRQDPQPQYRKFQRAAIRWPAPGQPDPLFADKGEIDFDEREELEGRHPIAQCYVCGTVHRVGFCPLKLAGPEYCNLCGLAHLGQARSCPHIRSETQVREMLAALKQSPENKHLIELARKYLTGVKGTLVQDKKRKAEKQAFETALKASQTTWFPTKQPLSTGQTAPTDRPPTAAPTEQGLPRPSKSQPLPIGTPVRPNESGGVNVAPPVQSQPGLEGHQQRAPQNGILPPKKRSQPRPHGPGF